MGKSINFIALSALSILSACTWIAVQDSDLNGFEKYDSIAFSINVPKGFTYSEMAPSKEYFYFGYPIGNSIGTKLIEIHEEFSTCPLTERHMPSMKRGIGGDSNVKWGQVKFKYTWDPLPGENDVFCRSIEEPHKTSAYAFCAEKDGKAVAICIQQMTDDEALAKEIFESFRWTE